MTLDHRTVLQRGVARKELDPGLDFELALDLLGGPLFYRLLVTGGPLDDALARGVVDVMLHGVGRRRVGRSAIEHPEGVIVVDAGSRGLRSRLVTLRQVCRTTDKLSNPASRTGHLAGCFKSF